MPICQRASALSKGCLCGPLLSNRTVILVTHHVELVLPSAHYVVRVLDGRIDAQGTVQELNTQGVLEVITHEAAVEVNNKKIPAVDVAGDIPTVDLKPLIAPTNERKPRKLVEDERREIGSVKWSVYQTYLSASGYRIWGVLLLLVIVQELRAVGEKLWIKLWAGAYQTPLLLRLLASGTSESSRFYLTDSLLPSASNSPFFYIGVYAAIAIFGIVLRLSSLALQYTAALRASRILFKRLLISVVGATFRFHDTTPQGRILSRFGSDLNTIDMRIAASLQELNTSLGGFFVSILTVIVVFPPFLVPAAIISLMYRFLAIGYVNTGRDLRRMESNNRSPIFSDFGEVLAGIVTVRAFSAEKHFLYNFFNSVDGMNQMWYNFWMLNRWLQLNFDVLCALSAFITALFAIATLHNDAGLAGLAITSALTFSGNVYWACRAWTDLELDLNSVERIVEYTELAQDPPAIIESHRPPAYWPSSAANRSLVVVENLYLKYAPDLPAVLHGVSFELKAGERVGLVGRTGSGKSSLVMSLLRFVDPSSGRIMIDGIDITKIGIYDLRSRITFIPQDATLFSGTLRENLDPFGEYEDSVCLDVLRRVRLVQEENSSDTPSPLSSHLLFHWRLKVSAGGNNFSQGQRQLIALARALLRRSSIVVLDEATSSVDFETDAKIQKTIREEFTGSLLITVAHRLRTIVDYDRLLVLDKGKVAGLDTPLALMQQENGIFRGMCVKSGIFEELEAAAKDHSTV
ncbi:P-loop containing nucleoside triphosphate hydrolase protein [Mycena alexandri]|uniref:P-loop containing nucleoside triphosphate hydrolase protein n=1 Tax=Mycena alexandri TaxID=1745969 RepID=A0AAD6T9U1_9AGAR|nr:P-loop containing nucleoside triphosphate hydrolase protein [Mycena alexandri]